MIEVLPLVVSFSGGRTSAFMSKYIQERYPERAKVFVFSNTGKEREETLRFVDQCDKEFSLGVVWIEAVFNPEYGKGTRHKVVDFETAARDGEPFEAMIKKFGIPNTAAPFCSKELKNAAIKSYIKRGLGWKMYETAIGIRADEEHRINRIRAYQHRWIYPLADEVRVDKKFVLDWWKRQPFDLQLRDDQGNCDLCYKKSEKKLVRLITEEPRRADWWSDMEKKYSHMQIEGKRHNTGQYFYRGNTSTEELRELAELKKRQGDLFPVLSDYETDCFCKST